MKLIRDFFSIDKITEGKFTRKTMIERMVLVRNFVLACVFVMALFFGKELAQMFVGMHRLQQHRKQYCKHQPRIDYGQPFFHHVKSSKVTKERNAF